MAEMFNCTLYLYFFRSNGIIFIHIIRLLSGSLFARTKLMVDNHVTSKQQQWPIPLKKPVDSGKTFFDFPINTGQICMGFETDTPKK